MPDTVNGKAEQALDADGLAEVTWEACDARMACCLTASPQDARGRGMLLSVERGGEPLDLSGGGVRLYLLWRHLQAHRRGCEPMEAADAAAGRFRVFWPAAMAAEEGEAQCEVVVSWDGRTLASPAFEVEVGPSLAGTLSVPDGFTLFAEAIRRYEGATQEALAVAAEIRAARDAGELTGPTGPVGPQGPKGDPFTYGDFTGEQLAALTGPKGEDGRDAEPPLVVPVTTRGYGSAEVGEGVVFSEVLAAALAGQAILARVTITTWSGKSNGDFLLPMQSASSGCVTFEGMVSCREVYWYGTSTLRVTLSSDGTATAYVAHSEGEETQATATGAHAEGSSTKAISSYAHAEGRETNAGGDAGHAEGIGSQTYGECSHAEGYYSRTFGEYSHAEGGSETGGDYAHSEGKDTSARGTASHAEGVGTSADGWAKHAEGSYPPVEVDEWKEDTPYAVGAMVESRNVLYICKEAHTSGKNEIDTRKWDAQDATHHGRYLHVVGNGTDAKHRSAAHTLEWDGTAWFAKAVYVGGTSGTERDDGSARLCTVDEAKALVGAGGRDGVSCTHSWDGTVLTVTSASGTSSADLRGPKGDKGDAGEQGPAGPAGATGATGPQGPRGETGEAGSPLTYEDLTAEQLEALRGETGPTGPEGPQGPAGATGPQGPAGADGKDGVSCTHSWDGKVLTITSASGTSSADLRGPKGDTGETGPEGPRGETGPAGPQGEAGPQGPAGADGARGPAGADGAPGKDGSDGTSCTHSWDGTVLTVTSASGTSSADLRGPKGDTGATGATGPEGPRGETGATGPEGPQGPKGDTGPAGPQGPAGRDGTPVDLTAYATKEWVAQQFPDLSGVSF